MSKNYQPHFMQKNKELEHQMHNQYGVYYHSIGKYQKAVEHLKVSLTISKEIGDKKGEAVAYCNLGSSYYSLGQYDKAIQFQEMSLSISKEIGDKNGESAAYLNLGTSYYSLGQYDKVVKYNKMSLCISKEIGDKNGESTAYLNLGSSYYSLDQYDKAIQFGEMSLSISKENGNKKGEGTAYRTLGGSYYSLGQYDKAIKYNEMSLSISKEIGDKNGESTAYLNFGSLYYSLGQYDKAIQFEEMSLSISKEIGNKNGEGTAYRNLGGSYYSLGQYDKAIKYNEMSLSISKEIGDKNGESTAYLNLGTSYYSLGQFDKAIKYNEMSLSISKEIGDKNGESTAYLNLGNSYYSLGQYDKAIKYNEMSLSISKEIGDKKGESAAYRNLGSSYHSLGQYKKAIQFEDKSLSIAKEIGDKNGESVAYRNLGDSFHSLGQYDKAIQFEEMSLSISKAIGDKNGESTAYRNLGDSYHSLGQYDKAIQFEEMSLSISKEIGDKNGESTAYLNLGSSYYSLDQYDKAIKYNKISLSIAKEIGNKNGESLAYRNLGGSYYSLGQYEKAETNLRKSMKCFENLFENVSKKDEDKVSIIDTFKGIFKAFIQVLFDQEKVDEALIMADKGRSRALVELMLTADLPGHVLFYGPKISHLHEIRKVVQALGSTVLYFSLGFSLSKWVIQRNGNIFFQERCLGESEHTKECHMKVCSTHCEDSINSLIDKVAEFMKAPGRAVTCEDRSLSFLYPEEVLKPAKKKPASSLGYRAMSVDFAFPKAAVSHLKVPLPEPIEGQELASSAACVCRDQPKDSGNRKKVDESSLNSLLKRLYEILLKPVRQYVVGSQAVVVPDGKLALVPFSALIDENGQYVAESLQVRLVPSLGTAKMIRERPEEPSGRGQPLVIGDPDIGTVKMDGKIITAPRLPCAMKEVEWVGEVLGVKPLIGKRATKQRFLRKMESANLIHIAAHGHAERGEILLAPCFHSDIHDVDDVMLRISDLEHKRIMAKLVVLSCCHSGCGQVKTEGVIGIARAFLGAGARAVVVALWDVDEVATLLFMAHFYENLRCGKSTNESLNIAMNAVRKDAVKDFHHPGFWAPFVLIGEDAVILGQSK